METNNEKPQLTERVAEALFESGEPLEEFGLSIATLLYKISGGKKMEVSVDSKFLWLLKCVFGSGHEVWEHVRIETKKPRCPRCSGPNVVYMGTWDSVPSGEKHPTTIKLDEYQCQNCQNGAFWI